MPMNATEHIAHAWLKKKYPSGDIVFRYSKSPDFVIDGKIGVEAKRGHAARTGEIHIVAATTQIGDLQAYPTSYMLIVSNSDAHTLDGKLLKKDRETYGQIIVHWQDKNAGYTPITILKALRDHLVEHRKKDESLEDTIWRLVGERRE